jgi:hypothetical protein
MEGADSSESSMHIYQTTQSHIPEYYFHHSHHWENLKSHSGHLALRFMSTMGKTASICPPTQFNIQLRPHISCDVTKYCQYKPVTKGFSQSLPSYLQRYKLWQTSGGKTISQPKGKTGNFCSSYVENFFHSMDSKPFGTGCLKINSSLLLNRYGAVLVLGLKRPGVKLTSQFHLLHRLRMSGAMPLLPLCFYDVKRDDVTCNFKRQSTFSFICAVRPYS